VYVATETDDGESDCWTKATSPNNELVDFPPSLRQPALNAQLFFGK